MREPLLWFVILGCLLFAADSYLNQKSDTIVVDQALRERLDKLWQAQTGNVARPDELESLVDTWMKEEILYREALSLGLDKDDAIVRRRLVQKLNFLVEDVEDGAIEKQAVLDYYKENLMRYTLPDRYSFAQKYFAELNDASAALSLLMSGEEVGSIGETSMLNDDYRARSLREISGDFGAEFSRAFSQEITEFNEQIESPQDQRWTGPIRSSFGYHLIRIDEQIPGVPTPFEYIEKRIVADYRQSKLDVAMQDYYESLRDKYKVEFR